MVIYPVPHLNYRWQGCLIRFRHQVALWLYQDHTHMVYSMGRTSKENPTHANILIIKLSNIFVTFFRINIDQTDLYQNCVLLM